MPIYSVYQNPVFDLYILNRNYSLSSALLISLSTASAGSTVYFDNVCFCSHHNGVSHAPRRGAGHCSLLVSGV